MTLSKTEIEMDFDGYYAEPRHDGKYRFAIYLGDLDGSDPADMLAILTSPEAQALEEAHFDFDYEARNGVGSLVGYRLATAEELARLKAKQDRDAEIRVKLDREALDRIKKAHPEWLSEHSGD